jgi:hypothetical protein
MIINAIPSIHTYKSGLLLNFVATTVSPTVAFNNQTIDKLILFLWRPIEYTLYVDKNKLHQQEPVVRLDHLPVLNDSFHPLENEVSFKGVILPHLILCIHDIESDEIFFNPAMVKEKPNWIEDWLDVNQSNFISFIRQTKYQRFLTLTENLVEDKVS